MYIIKAKLIISRKPWFVSKNYGLFAGEAFFKQNELLYCPTKLSARLHIQRIIKQRIVKGNTICTFSIHRKNKNVYN